MLYSSQCSGWTAICILKQYWAGPYSVICSQAFGAILKVSESPCSLALLCTFHMSIERDDSTKNQCLLRKSRCGANTVCSTFVCQFMWWLKFQYKHVTLLISCQFNRTVSLAVSGCFHVHFTTEELHLICFLAVIEEHDEFSKKYRWFLIYLTIQTSEPSVLAANFYKLIADFCISRIQFCCSCFSIFWKNRIYSTFSGKGKQYC